MSGNSVAGVIVTFRPRAEDLSNIAKLRPQVEDLVVVDNGSPEDKLQLLRTASRELNFVLIENGDNLGIGAALNIGVKWAGANGSKWVALFDQDSTVTDGFISQMLAGFEDAASRCNLGLLVPRYKDPKSGIERIFGLAKDRGPFVTITSGSFFRADIFQKCGYFQEDLFIYAVDDEYSLRLRSKGYSIAQSQHAILLHASGYPSHYCLFGKRIFSPSNHSAGARYYLNRNRIWMLRVYGRRFPRWTHEVILASAKEIVKIAIAEKDRWFKVRMIIIGIRDGLSMRMGKTVNL
jgi:rhamnosyltransferase